MEQNIVAKPIFVEEKVVAKSAAEIEENVVPQPLLAGIIYGEIVFWIIVASIVIAITGLVLYITYGGYFDSKSLLSYLWGGSDCLSIWKEVGNASQPLPWYSCATMLYKGDMLAMLGLVFTGIAGAVGMWGAFVGMLRSKSRIYTIFAFIIAVILTLSVMGILKIH